MVDPTLHRRRLCRWRNAQWLGQGSNWQISGATQEARGRWQLAKRINHQGVKFPTPTKALLEGLAVAGYAAFANSIDLEIDAQIRDWDDASDHVKTAWYDASKAMYATLAVIAGATVTQIPENRPPDEKL
tara:strand:+ start:1404 stop:1793 length:390 start_codon:yes stop_codon:yes gene_type:complete